MIVKNVGITTFTLHSKNNVKSLAIKTIWYSNFVEYLISLRVIYILMEQRDIRRKWLTNEEYHTLREVELSRNVSWRVLHGL